MDSIQYRASLAADPDRISPVQHYLQSHPTGHLRQELVYRFAAAQRAFLGSTIAEAQEKFIGVLDLLWKDDWARGDRRIFLICYLRLAQMSENSLKREGFLKSALLVGDVAVDKDLFPPPLLDEFQKLSAARSILRVQNTKWDRVLINGKACEADSCGRWPKSSEKVRVTYLSNQWEPQSKIMTLDKIPSWDPKEIAFAPINQSDPSLNLRPAEKSIVPIETKEESAPFYKNKWLWTGVGVTALIIILSNQGKTVHEPSTTYGF